MIAQVFKREFKTGRKFDSVGDCFRQIGKERLHLLRRFQVAFGISCEQLSGSVQSAVIPNCGEDIAKFAGFWSCIAHAICGEHWQPKRAGDFNGGAIPHLLLTMEVTLQLDIDIFTAKYMHQKFD